MGMRVLGWKSLDALLSIKSPSLEARGNLTLRLVAFDVQCSGTEG